MDLQDLSPGESILGPTTLLLTPQEVQGYLAAVEDQQPLYQGQQLVPPMALAARAIRELITHLSLPPGATHIAQEVESLAPCALGTALTLESEVSQNAVRGGWRFLGIAFEVRQEEGTPVLRGASTVLIPLG